MAQKNNITHPAKFTDNLIPEIANMLSDINHGRILDPFAGTGKIALIKRYNFNGTVYANEIEPEWIANNEFGCDVITMQDAEFLDYPECYFDAICTSPTYGNRMADHHVAKDGSKRLTYTHCLGRQLNNENTGKMQFGDDYINKHVKIYRHLFTLVKWGGYFILNIKNHIRKGEEIDVVGFHKKALSDVGFMEIQDLIVKTPCMGFGRNRNKRIYEEHIIKFIKPITENSLMIKEE